MDVSSATDQPLIIAIDGFSGCGKSTLAKDLATTLGYIHIDSGSLYRAITLDFIRREIDITDTASILDALSNIDLHLTLKDGISAPILSGVNVSKEIKSPQVAQLVSEVAALPEVRSFLIEKQRYFGKNKAVIMDGRDIGTVIFPEAELKLFITADMEVRIDRRLQELRDKGIKTTSEEVGNNLEKRDRIDSSREVSPLKQAEDAIILNTSNLSREQQVQKALEYVMAVISGKK